VGPDGRESNPYCRHTTLSQRRASSKRKDAGRMKALDSDYSGGKALVRALLFNGNIHSVIETCLFLKNLL
jgi:hypothetical protein